MQRFAINNFRCMLGQQKHGVQFGGDMIAHKFADRLIKKNCAADIYHIAINNYRDYQKGYNMVKINANKGYFNVNLGGDHSISAATIQPLLNKYREDLLVIWIDAHADLNTYNASLTKNLHGMPVGALMGLMDHWYETNDRRFLLRPENLLYAGIRDLDAFETNTITEKVIINFPQFTVDLVNTIKNHPAKYIHISCDIDSMDPYLMPSTGTTVPHGLTITNVKKIIKLAQPRLVSFDLVEFNPLIGNRREVKRTLANIYKILELL